MKFMFFEKKTRLSDFDLMLLHKKVMRKLIREAMIKPTQEELQWSIVLAKDYALCIVFFFFFLDFFLTVQPSI